MELLSQDRVLRAEEMAELFDSTSNPFRRDFIERFHRRLIPAVPVWLRPEGGINEPVLRSYAKAMSLEDVAGVAINVHTGRGPYLSSEEWSQVIRIWSEEGAGLKLIVGVSSVEQVGMLKGLKREGAGVYAAMIMPPRKSLDGLDDPGREEKIVGYHTKIASAAEKAGMSVGLFYLYEQAGGVHYTQSEMQRLLGMENVVFIKSAGLSNIELFKNMTQIISQSAPGVAIVTGEDFFFTESVDFALVSAPHIWGRKLPVAGLVGMSAAIPGLEARYLRVAGIRGMAEDAFRLKPLIDDKAVATFIHPSFMEYSKPMEPYVQNMMFLASVWLGLPVDQIFDPLSRVNPKRGINEVLVDPISERPDRMEAVRGFYGRLPDEFKRKELICLDDVPYRPAGKIILPSDQNLRRV